MGRSLAQALLSRGHQVRLLVRPGSQAKAQAACEVVSGDPLVAESFVSQVSPSDTWVHLVGTPHPNPKKAEEFKAIDLRSVEVAAPAAIAFGIRHFVYVSVAHPAPMMKAYLEVRSRCEDIIRNSGLNSTFLRPWYVLGPGQRWPYLLKPAYALFERIPSTAASAQRLGLVTLPQMVGALVTAVENPAVGICVMEVPEIRCNLA